MRQGEEGGRGGKGEDGGGKEEGGRDDFCCREGRRREGGREGTCNFVYAVYLDGTWDGREKRHCSSLLLVVLFILISTHIYVYYYFHITHLFPLLISGWRVPYFFDWGGWEGGRV